MISNRRCSDLNGISMPGGRCSLVESPVQLLEGNLFLLSSEMAIRADNECMGFVRQLQSESGTEVTVLEGIIVKLTRLGAYLATAVACFNDDVTDKAGSRRQKLYHDIFGSFVPMPYKQLNDCIRIFVAVWLAEDL